MKSDKIEADSISTLETIQIYSEYSNLHHICSTVTVLYKDWQRMETVRIQIRLDSKFDDVSLCYFYLRNMQHVEECKKFDKGQECSTIQIFLNKSVWPAQRSQEHREMCAKGRSINNYSRLRVKVFLFKGSTPVEELWSPISIREMFSASRFRAMWRTNSFLTLPVEVVGKGSLLTRKSLGTLYLHTTETSSLASTNEVVGHRTCFYGSQVAHSEAYWGCSDCH